MAATYRAGDPGRPARAQRPEDHTLGAPSWSVAGAEKFLDGPEDGVAIGDSAANDVLAVGQFVDMLIEFAAAVGAFHLAVAEQVQVGQQLVLEYFQAVG